MAKNEYLLVLDVERGYLNSQTTDADLDAQGIKKVFHYRNLQICVVELEDLSANAYSMASTAHITPIVETLFPLEHNGPIMFTWAAIPSAELTTLDPKRPKIEPTPGAASGAGLEGG